MSKEAHNAVESYDFVDPATGKAAIRDKHMLVLYCLAYNADADGVAWVGLEKLASHARTSKRHVIRLIQELEEKGYLGVRRPSKAGRGRSNLYVLRLSPLDSEAAAAKATQLSHLLESGLGIREAASLLKGDNLTRNGDLTAPDQPLIGVGENTNTHTHVVEEKGKERQPIPDDFCLTRKMRYWGEKECPGLDLEEETREFIFYWSKGGGKGFEHNDWPGAWRKRMREQAKFKQRGAGRQLIGVEEGGKRDELEGTKSLSRWGNGADRKGASRQRRERELGADVYKPSRGLVISGSKRRNTSG